jgi:hypothetical protein
MHSDSIQFILLFSEKVQYKYWYYQSRLGVLIANLVEVKAFHRMLVTLDIATYLSRTSRVEYSGTNYSTCIHHFNLRKYSTIRITRARTRTTTLILISVLRSCNTSFVFQHVANLQLCKMHYKVYSSIANVRTF